MPEDDLLDILEKYWYLIVIGVAVVLILFYSYAYKQQKDKRKDIEIAYDTDSLTGLMAMHKFRDEMEKTISNAKSKEYELISLDMDMFRTINTHYSQEKGTKVICAIADALSETFIDTQKIISRRKAEQFLVLRKTGNRGALEDIYKEEILPAIRKVLGEKYRVAMSFGYVLINGHNDTTTDIIGHANDARMMGKNTHQTTFIKFDEAMRKNYNNVVDVTFRMEQAVKDKEFVVVYQPKIDFKTLKVCGAEALVRWFPKLGDPIYPDAFIPVMEANGFISTLDIYVLNEVCEFLKNNKKVKNMPKISVNLSACSVLEERIISRIVDVLNLHEIKPSAIELEITESALVGDESRFLEKIQKLKKRGFNIAIDDFGAGVSSLNRLSALDADVLKLDKEFFNHKSQEVKSVVIVQDVIVMAKHLDMDVVAEGVETFMQAMWLKEINCDIAQGYYFERPLNEDVFLNLVKEDKTYEIKNKVQ